MTLKSVVTRAKLVSIAERLFAERGIEGVSLSDINKAAGQRNKNATSYHFGSKDGLLQAILDKHEPGIATRRNALLDQLELRGSPSVRDVVRALMYPMADKMFDPDGGKDFIRLDAQLVAMHTLSVQNLRASTLNLGQVDRLRRALLEVLQGLPESVAQQRLHLAAVLLLHGLADHSRMLDASEKKTLVMDTELFASQAPHGSGAGPFTQFSALANIRAVVVLPHPLGPANTNACATRPLAIALRSVRVTGCWPTTSSKRCGRHLRARTW